METADTPAVDGLRLRSLREAEDYAALADVVREANVHDGLDWVPDAASLQVEFENSHDFDPRRDVVLAEADGTVVGWGEARRQVRDGLAVYVTAGSVRPGWRRRGIGRQILHHNLRHLRERAAGFDDPGGRAFGAWSSDRERGAAQLVTSEGFVPVRYSFSMARPTTTDDLPDAPLPAGLEIRAVEPAHHRAIFDADNEAFRDHWGHREQTEEDFVRVFSMPDLDTGLWSVAWDGDEVVGSVTTIIYRSDNEALGVRRGWLEHISVRRPWRRRGVARALIVDAVRRLAGDGMDQAMLGVDAENPTGALQLYESLGFRVKDRATSYRRPW